MFATIPCCRQVDINGNTKMSIKSWRLLLQTHSTKKLQLEAIITFTIIYQENKKPYKNHMLVIQHHNFFLNNKSPKKYIIIWKARSWLDVQNKMNVWNKRDEWQLRELNKKVKWKRLTNEVNKIIKWNNEINEFCDWKWSDDQWI
jgi:hypothetical protein